jgi:hypothetical protein
MTVPVPMTYNLISFVTDVGVGAMILISLLLF